MPPRRLAPPPAAALAAAALLAGCAAAPPERRAYPPGGLAARLEDRRVAAGLPSLALVVVDDRGVLDAAAVGVRRVGRDATVTLDDAFQLGSVGKTVTAAVALRLVARGAVSWNTTVAQTWPTLAPRLDPAWRRVTLRRLLSHTAGVGDRPAHARLPARVAPLVDPRAQRRRAVELALGEAPPAPPGPAFEYSNVGFAVAGAMLEARAGEAWETLVRREVLGPLGLRGGFGPPALDDPDAPWGHRLSGGRLRAVSPPDEARVTAPVFAPAGTLHLSPRDLGEYARVVLRAARGARTPLGDARALFAPVVAQDGPGRLSYALGWNVQALGTGGRLLFHFGTDTAFTALVAVMPERNRAYAVVTNAGGAAVPSVLSAVVNEAAAGKRKPAGGAR